MALPMKLVCSRQQVKLQGVYTDTSMVVRTSSILGTRVLRNVIYSHAKERLNPKLCDGKVSTVLVQHQYRPYATAYARGGLAGHPSHDDTKSAPYRCALGVPTVASSRAQRPFSILVYHLPSLTISAAGEQVDLSRAEQEAHGLFFTSRFLAPHCCAEKSVHLPRSAEKIPVLEKTSNRRIEALFSLALGANRDNVRLKREVDYQAQGAFVLMRPFIRGGPAHRRSQAECRWGHVDRVSSRWERRLPMFAPGYTTRVFASNSLASPTKCQLEGRRHGDQGMDRLPEDPESTAFRYQQGSSTCEYSRSH
ncbi:hypothetical protein EJ04DRAFT_522684 [Polyplosphaeria fusca]|uniref:Uncharacterized protein n=1 Tax=Polyplosphaeria fusca TaxID=682080 RepID=A0A9P4QXY9_9PLEO|nr:hypothetical protein EJ04DRAFT_522684 [Polyplosphaeria fusca]